MIDTLSHDGGAATAHHDTPQLDQERAHRQQVKLADLATDAASEVAWSICGRPSARAMTPAQIADAKRLIEHYRDDAEGDALTFTSQLFEILTSNVRDAEEA